MIWFIFKRYPRFHPLIIISIFLVFQEVWANLVIRDVFNGFILLDTSETSNLINQNVILELVSICLFWDYKYTLFFVGPVWMTGDYFFLTGQNEFLGTEFNNVSSAMIKDSVSLVTVLMANYVI